MPGDADSQSQGRSDWLKSMPKRVVHSVEQTLAFQVRALEEEIDDLEATVTRTIELSQKVEENIQRLKRKVQARPPRRPDARLRLGCETPQFALTPVPSSGWLY
jgi:septal ring factor EnvC (AmiA/AmiB activator)